MEKQNFFKVFGKIFIMPLLSICFIFIIFAMSGCGNEESSQQNIVINNDNLPPDPGEAGKATIGGIDVDNDGVRDDVQRYIAIKYADSEKRRAVLTQYAKIFQNALLDSDSKEKSIKHAEEISRAGSCSSYMFGAREAMDISKDLRVLLLNTKDRSFAYFSYDEKLGGEVFSLIPDEKVACDFNPDLMEK